MSVNTHNHRIREFETGRCYWPVMLAKLVRLQVQVTLLKNEVGSDWGRHLTIVCDLYMCLHIHNTHMYLCTHTYTYTYTITLTSHNLGNGNHIASSSRTFSFCLLCSFGCWVKWPLVLSHMYHYFLHSWNSYKIIIERFLKNVGQWSHIVYRYLLFYQ